MNELTIVSQDELHQVVGARHMVSQKMVPPATKWLSSRRGRRPGGPSVGTTSITSA